MSRRRGRRHHGFTPTIPRRRLRYSKTRILFDFVLTILTGGLWLLWIVIRFLRSNT